MFLAASIRKNEQKLGHRNKPTYQRIAYASGNNRLTDQDWFTHAFAIYTIRNRISRCLPICYLITYTLPKSLATLTSLKSMYVYVPVLFHIWKCLSHGHHLCIRMHKVIKNTLYICLLLWWLIRLEESHMCIYNIISHVFLIPTQP